MTESALILGLVAALSFGVSIGSFLNVVIWRVPRGESVSTPTWSYCPNCHERLRGWDLIPLLSFLALGQKCRYCKKPISWRYITVETITGLLFAGLFLKYGWTLDTVFYCLFAAVMVAALYIDLEFFIIPDELNVLGVVFGVALNISHYWYARPPATWDIGGFHVLESVVSAVLCALIFHAISFFGYLYYTSPKRLPEAQPTSDEESLPTGLFARAGWFIGGVVDDYAYLWAKYTGLGFLSPKIKAWIAEHEVTEDVTSQDGAGAKTHEEIAKEIEEEEEQTGMGQGDAKLAAAIGAVLLFKYAVLSFFLAIVMGGIISIGMMLFQKSGGRTPIPFGPYLVLAALATLFVGEPLLTAYLHYAFPVPAQRGY
jgi:leader peptidase (prepilin peptidase)/N-methyltransferase